MSTRKLSIQIFFLLALLVASASNANARSAIVQRNNTPVFFQPSMKSFRLFLLPQFSVVTVIKQDGEWTQIEFETKDAPLRGWVKQRWLEPPKEAKPAPPPVPKEVQELAAQSAPETQTVPSAFDPMKFYVSLGAALVSHSGTLDNALSYNRTLVGGAVELVWLPVRLAHRPNAVAYNIGWMTEALFAPVNSESTFDGSLQVNPAAASLKGYFLDLRFGPAFELLFPKSIRLLMGLGVQIEQLKLSDLPRTLNDDVIFVSQFRLRPLLNVSARYEIPHPTLSFGFTTGGTIGLPFGSASDDPSTTAQSLAPGLLISGFGEIYYRLRPLYAPLTVAVRLDYDMKTTSYSGLGSRAGLALQDTSLTEKNLIVRFPIGLSF